MTSTRSFPIVHTVATHGDGTPTPSCPIGTDEERRDALIALGISPDRATPALYQWMNAVATRNGIATEPFISPDIMATIIEQSPVGWIFFMAGAVAPAAPETAGDA